MKASVGNCITHKSGTVNLPMANAELDKWLGDNLGTTERTNIVVHEICLPGLDESFNYDDIDEVNVMAAVFENDYDDKYDDAVRAWIDQYGHSLNALNVANIMRDAEHVPWRTYGYGGDTPEERFGRMWLNEVCFDEMRTLDDLGMLEYIDFEAYGKDKAFDCALYDEGYLDMGESGPDDDWYSLEDLQEEYELVEEEDE